MTDKKNKVRTSITIDPDLLREIRGRADTSVSAYIEKALREYKQREDECAVAAQEFVTDF